MPERIELYNLSCPELPVLLRHLRHESGTSAVWRRALIVTLERMGQRQESLARVTAAQLLPTISSQAIVGSPPHSPTSARARAMVGHFREMKSRRYSRGQLTPSQGYHPEVLELFVRRAQKKLTPL